MNIEDYYNQGREQARLTQGGGSVEFIRTQEIIRRYLPEPPLTILDVGGGAGIHAQWLVGAGYTVHLVDLMPLHIEQAQEAIPGLASATVGDSRELKFPDASVDVVLLLGPLYHLPEQADRAATLKEAHRVLKPGGWLFAATISRFASMLDGMFRGYHQDAHFAALARQDIVDGQHRNPTGQRGYFTTAYFHHPHEIPTEIVDTGLQLEALMTIEGAAAFIPDIEKFWDDPELRERLLHFLRSTESEPTMLGTTGHLMAVAKKIS